MRRTTWIFVILLGLGATARAQTSSDFKNWDVAGSASLFYEKPGDINSITGDDWYFNGRYAAAIGHYWTEHLKTEAEYAISGEGSLFRQELRNVGGQDPAFPVGVETFHRLEQYSARMVWQFGSNSWVHPYVSGGFVVDRERERLFIPAQYQFVSGRNPILAVPELHSGPTWQYRLGYSVGAGTKIYISPNAFFNTGVLATFSKPAQTVSVLGGFGIDF